MEMSLPSCSTIILEMVQIVVMSAPLSSISSKMSARPQCAVSAYCNCQLGLQSVSSLADCQLH